MKTKNEAFMSDNGEWSPFDMAMSIAEGDKSIGPVRTQHDMTPKEISFLEDKYGAKIQMDVEVRVHTPTDDKSICNGWFHQQHRRRRDIKNAEARQEEVR